MKGGCWEGRGREEVTAFFYAQWLLEVTTDDLRFCFLLWFCFSRYPPEQ